MSAPMGRTFIVGNGVAQFLGENGRLTGVKLDNGTELPCEVAVVAVGVRPNTRLAQSAGIAIGEFGGIAVNEFMQTSDPDIYAVGDCVRVYLADHRAEDACPLWRYRQSSGTGGRSET